MAHPFLIAAAWLALTVPPALAQDRPPLHERNVFVLTGRMLNADMGQSLNVLGAGYESNYVTGIGYQDFFWRTRRSSIGYELGIAARYGDDSTTEAWGGLVASMDNIHLLDNLFLSPSIVFGLSWVNATHAGREQRLEDEYGGDAGLVFYLGPEVDFKVSPDSRYSLFWRLHHRSGAWKTLGDIKGASNANVFGLRVRF